jgi:hypothetical protein
MADLYKTHFGYSVHREPHDRIVELRPPGTGAILLLHPAAKGQRAGQSAAKLVFACEDVETFREVSRERGLTFGALHRGDGYVFANAKDPSGNAISISGRITTV